MLVWCTRCFSYRDPLAKQSLLYCGIGSFVSHFCINCPCDCGSGARCGGIKKNSIVWFMVANPLCNVFNHCLCLCNQINTVDLFKFSNIDLDSHRSCFSVFLATYAVKFIGLTLLLRKFNEVCVF